MLDLFEMLFPGKRREVADALLELFREFSSKHVLKHMQRLERTNLPLCSFHHERHLAAAALASFKSSLPGPAVALVAGMG